MIGVAILFSFNFSLTIALWLIGGSVKQFVPGPAISAGIAALEYFVLRRSSSPRLIAASIVITGLSIVGTITFAVYMSGALHSPVIFLYGLMIFSWILFTNPRI